MKEHKNIRIKAENQYIAGREFKENIYYDITFHQVHVNSSPRAYETDESNQIVFPHEARIRSLTYATEIYVDVQLRKLEMEPMDKVGYSQTGEKKQPKVLRVLEDLGTARELVGRCPVMIKSNFCHLSKLNELEITKNAKECGYDQGGYFIINGGEKVLIA